MQQLMTEEIAKTVPRLYEQDGAEDPTVYAHYFSCVNGWDWWLLEFDGTDEAFGLLERQDVVDTVARHGHGVSAAFERLYELALLLRRHTPKDVITVHRRVELG